MDKEMETIFAPLKATLEAQSYGTDDLLDFVGNWCAASPPLGSAFALHARDIIREGDYGTTAELIAETYRRTFFDRPHAEKYETSQMLDKGADIMKEFVGHLVEQITLDEQEAEIEENSALAH